MPSMSDNANIDEDIIVSVINDDLHRHVETKRYLSISLRAVNPSR